VGIVESAARRIKAERSRRFIVFDDNGKGSELRAEGSGSHPTNSPEP
jgi:hypothetical protein